MEKKKIPLGRGEIVKPLDRSPSPPTMTDKDIQRKLLFQYKDLETFKKLKNARMVLLVEERIKALESDLSGARKKN